MQEEALVDDTFLHQLQRRRDLQKKQLQTPACVPGSVPPSVVSNQVPHANEANSSPIPSPVTIASDLPTCCISGANHRNVTPSSIVNYASSARACNAIFVLEPTNVNALPMPSEVRVAQERDQALQRWITQHHTSTSRFKPGLVECEDNTKVWADVCVTPARILVPTTLQRVVFDSLHHIAHPGVTVGMTLIKRTYWWQGIGKDVARWTKSCEASQKAKVHKHTKAPLERLPPPTKRFSHIHVDLVGPLNPACEGKNTLPTVIDRWTRWPEAFPMTMHGDAANTKACAKVLVRQWIARLGVPDIITSDRGSQFASDLWLEVCRLMGIARDPTTSYHPQHNGKVERMHRCLQIGSPNCHG